MAVGTALHETNYTLNEQDTDTSSSGATTTTYGLFQVNTDDKWARAKAPTADYWTLEGQCEIFAGVCEYYMGRLLAAANKYNAAHGLPPLEADSPPPDLWSYIAISHNQGLGAALKSIATYGMGWQRYRDENGQSVNVSAVRDNGVYGDDVQTGGADFDAAYASSSSSSSSSGDGGDDPLDDSGAPIAAPRFSASMRGNIRLALVALLALLVLYAVLQRTPWKVSIS